MSDMFTFIYSIFSSIAGVGVSVSCPMHVSVLITVTKYLMLFAGSGSTNSNAFCFSKYISKALEICQASIDSIRIWTRKAGRKFLWISWEASCECWLVNGGDNGRIISCFQKKTTELPPISKANTDPTISEASEWLASTGKFRDSSRRWTTVYRHKGANPSKNLSFHVERCRKNSTVAAK